MKILQVASFSGNIGDNASHIGLRKILDKVLPSYSITKLEIRKFYGNYKHADKLRFDEQFLRLLESYDMLFIGGGGFLDYWVPGSKTGTTIDMAPEILAAIKIPLIISSVGCMPHKAVPEGNIEKFRQFLDGLLEKPKTLVAVRNDGSRETLTKHIGIKYAEAIPEVLDHGFFYENDGSSYLPIEGRYVAINSTIDQLAMLNSKVGPIDIDHYYRELNTVIQHLFQNTPLNLVFVPHIHSDLVAINKVLSDIDDFFLRTRVAVAPFSTGDLACNQAFSAYRNSELNIGMRFHANVCSIAMGKPTIGIAALDRVLDLFTSMDLEGNAIKVDGNFASSVIRKVEAIVDTGNCASDFVVGDDLLQKKRQSTIQIYRNFIEKL